MGNFSRASGIDFFSLLLYPITLITPLQEQSSMDGRATIIHSLMLYGVEIMLFGFLIFINRVGTNEIGYSAYGLRKTKTILAAIYFGGITIATTQFYKYKLDQKSSYITASIVLVITVFLYNRSLLVLRDRVNNNENSITSDNG